MCACVNGGGEGVCIQKTVWAKGSLRHAALGGGSTGMAKAPGCCLPATSASASASASGAACHSPRHRPSAFSRCTAASSVTAAVGGQAGRGRPRGEGGGAHGTAKQRCAQTHLAENGNRPAKHACKPTGLGWGPPTGKPAAKKHTKTHIKTCINPQAICANVVLGGNDFGASHPRDPAATSTMPAGEQPPARHPGREGGNTAGTPRGPSPGGGWPGRPAPPCPSRAIARRAGNAVQGSAKPTQRNSSSACMHATHTHGRTQVISQFPRDRAAV